MIQNLIFVIPILKMLSREYNIGVQVLMDIIRFSIPDFLAEGHKVNKNYRKISLILQYSFGQKT